MGSINILLLLSFLFISCGPFQKKENDDNIHNDGFENSLDANFNKKSIKEGFISNQVKVVIDNKSSQVEVVVDDKEEKMNEDKKLNLTSPEISYANSDVIPDPNQIEGLIVDSVDAVIAGGYTQIDLQGAIGDSVIEKVGRRRCDPRNNIDRFNTSRSSIVFSFDVKKAGNYYIYVYAAVPNSSSDTAWLQIDKDISKTYLSLLPQTGDLNTYAWAQFTNGTGSVPDSNLGALEFTAGEHTIEIRCREGNNRIDAVAIVQTNVFDGNLPEVKTKRLVAFDLTEICGVKAELSFTVTEVDNETYSFAEPVLSSSSSLNINDIELVVNNQVNSKDFNIFKNVNTVVPAFSSNSISTQSMSIKRRIAGENLDVFAVTLGGCAVQ